MPHHSIADEQLMLELRAGGRGAFETLFER